MEFPFGIIVEHPPANVAPPEAWPEFGDSAYPPPICAREIVGTEPRGVRWTLWPLCFERYYSDEEPSLSDSAKGVLARNRMINWRRITRTDVPPGWRESKKGPWRIDGFVELTPNYTDAWSHDAQRNLRTWQKKQLETRYIIEVVQLGEFTDAYKKSLTRKKIGLDLLNALVRKYDIPLAKEHCILWGVRDIQTKRIVAGTAAFYFPKQSASVRECPFILEEARKTYAMTGLIDHWFAESVRRGIRTHLFTHFWHTGAPKGWKGFSEFKSHFGLSYIAYPPELIRFVRGKIF